MLIGKDFPMHVITKISYDMVSDNIQETNSILTNEMINIAGDYIPVKKINNKNQKPCVGSKLY